MGNLTPCLCGCGRAAHKRGLHVSCYGRLSKLVAAGMTTWARLVGQGKALAARRTTWNRHPKDR